MEIPEIVLQKMRKELENSEEIRALKKRSLKENVLSMYRSQFDIEGFFEPIILENFEIEGKIKKHNLDIYLEFKQINNCERTVVKIIEKRQVTEEDVWEFYNIVKDMHFFSKGIIYYDGTLTQEAKNLATKAKIEIKYFDVVSELFKYTATTLEKSIIPYEETIGDPFWVAMEINGEGKNTGNYFQIQNSIPLFLSYKQANTTIQNNPKYRIYGLSQKQFKTLINLMEISNQTNIVIAFPDFEQNGLEEFKTFSISSERLIRYYYRGEN